jgi:hypothetical protein
VWRYLLRAEFTNRFRSKYRVSSAVRRDQAEDLATMIGETGTIDSDKTAESSGQVADRDDAVLSGGLLAAHHVR